MPEDPKNERSKYEISDANAPAIAAAGAALALVTALCFLAGYVILKYSTEREAASAYEPSPLVMEHAEWNQDIRLQNDPEADFDRYFAEMAPAVHRYGVVSDNPEIYHFPIEDAIGYVAENGLPTFNPSGNEKRTALTH